MNFFNKQRFFLATIFAVAGYLVCLFFMERQEAIIVAIFIDAFYYLVFTIYGFFYSKKAIDVLNEFEEELVYRKVLNYYDNGRIENGWFLLTKYDLIFINLEKKAVPLVKIPLDDVQSIEYGKIFRHIRGMSIKRTDGTRADFSINQQEFTEFKTVLYAIRYNQC